MNFGRGSKLTTGGSLRLIYETFIIKNKLSITIPLDLKIHVSYADSGNFKGIVSAAISVMMEALIYKNIKFPKGFAASVGLEYIKSKIQDRLIPLVIKNTLLGKKNRDGSIDFNYYYRDSFTMYFNIV